MTVTMPTLILASTSRFRRALLDRLGLSYLALAPNFDESSSDDLLPPDLARTFAEGKARSIPSADDAWIIGSDQVAEIRGHVLRKTHSLQDCREQLRELSGQTHALHTAVALWSPLQQRMLSEVVTVELTMCKLDYAVIGRYVELDQPIGSAGGYFFEGRGIALFETVRGGDESAIVGLSLASVCRLLRQVGIEPISMMRKT